MKTKRKSVEIYPAEQFPHLQFANVPLPTPANTDEPMMREPTHLNKGDIGKSSGSNRVALLSRPHRRAMLQEFWCASYEECLVYICILGHPDFVNMREQFTRVDFIDGTGKPTFTKVDAHVLLKDGTEVLVSVKYHEKSVRPAYLDEVKLIAQQCPQAIADRFTVASRFLFHPDYRKCANDIHCVRRGWDPEADEHVLGVARSLGETFTFGQLVERSGLGNRGYQSAIRLIGDGDIRKHLLDRFEPDTKLYGVSA